MNEKKADLGTFFKGCVKAVLVGLAVYFILNAIAVLVLWFTSVPESVMTYLGGVCLAGGCLAGGIKMGRLTGHKGLISGLIAAAIISAVLWVIVSLISEVELLENVSLLKLASGAIAGMVGGAIGVNK